MTACHVLTYMYEHIFDVVLFIYSTTLTAALNVHLQSFINSSSIDPSTRTCLDFFKYMIMIVVIKNHTADDKAQ